MSPLHREAGTAELYGVRGAGQTVRLTVRRGERDKTKRERKHAVEIRQAASEKQASPKTGGIFGGAKTYFRESVQNANVTPKH